MIRIFSFKMYTNLLEKKFSVGQVNQHQHRDTWLEFMTHIQWLKQCHSQCDPLRDSETESMKLVRDLGTVLKCRPEIPTRAKVENLPIKPSSKKLFQAQMNSLISLRWTRLISKTNFLPKRYQDHIRYPGLFSRILNAFYVILIRFNGNQLKACNILMQSRLWDLLGWAAWALDKVFL